MIMIARQYLDLTLEEVLVRCYRGVHCNPGEEEYEYSEEEYNGNDGDDIAGDASDLAAGYLAPEEDGQLTLTAFL